MFHFKSNFQVSPFTSREEGLRRGFAALDSEQTGKIPVDKFKRRLREVTLEFNINVKSIASKNVISPAQHVSKCLIFQSVRLTEAEAQRVVRLSIEGFIKKTL